MLIINFQSLTNKRDQINYELTHNYMKRSPSSKLENERKKSQVQIAPIKSHTTPDDPSSFDKLESLHYESQSIQLQLEGLLARMKENINDQVYSFYIISMLRIILRMTAS
jgi:hypothetical protein